MARLRHKTPEAQVPKTMRYKRQHSRVVKGESAAVQTKSSSIVAQEREDREPAATQDETPERCYVIGLDFGATYSRGGWAYVDHDMFLNQRPVKSPTTVLDSYKRSPLGRANKVPSALLYHGEEILWGYEAMRSLPAKYALDHQFRFIKHLLHKKAVAEEEANRNRQAAKDLNLSDKEVVEAYLGKLHKKIMDALSREISGGERPIYYVLSVPAAWTSPELNTFLNIADRAGFTDPMLIFEPEAIAAHLFQTLGNEFKGGDVIIIADMGGLTVDLLTIKVNDEKPLSMKHAVVAEGEPCGSEIINHEYFKRWLKNRPALNTLDEDKFEQIFQKLEPQFEEMKIEFTGTFGDEPGFLHLEELRECIYVTDDDMKEIFEPVIQMIIEKIQEQIDYSKEKKYTPQKIILAGGLARSEYLSRRVRDEFQERGITVRQPQVPDTAVVEGCIIIALNKGLVSERLSRFGIGIQADVPHVRKSGVSQRGVYWDAHEGCLKKKVIDWWLKKGESVTSARVRTIHDRYRTTTRSLDSCERVWYEQIFISSIKCKDNAPRAMDFRRGRLPRGIEGLPELKFDLSGLSQQEFESLWELDDDEKQLRKLRYEVEMKLDEVNLNEVKFTARIPPGGPVRGEWTRDLSQSSLEQPNIGPSEATRGRYRPIVKRRKCDVMRGRRYNTRAAMLLGQQQHPAQDVTQSNGQDDPTSEASRDISQPSRASQNELALREQRMLQDNTHQLTTPGADSAPPSPSEDLPSMEAIIDRAWSGKP